MPDQGKPRVKVDIERLTRRMGKYALVVAVSQRARQLKDRASHLSDITPSDIVGRALGEIFDGKVKLLDQSKE
ncbi:MAG: DNA-directed RNA polymerase subunit omega [Armatimonadota bacterium]